MWNGTSALGTIHETGELLPGVETTPARSPTRARILLLSEWSPGQFQTDPDVAAALLCSEGTVANIRKRFLTEGLEAALYDKPRPGRAPKFTGDLEAQLTVLACSDLPKARPAGPCGS